MCTDDHHRIQTTLHPSRTMEMEKDHHPHIAFQRLPLSALSNTFRSRRHAQRSERQAPVRDVMSLGRIL